jgi:D-aspartate ligase
MTKSGSREVPVPAIVLGAGITTLGVIRNLGRRAIPVFNLSHKRDFCAWSRWGQSVDPSIPKFADADQLAACLEALPFERAVVFPCSDAHVEAMAVLGDRFVGRFASTATFRDVDLLIDKGRFVEAVSNLDVPLPRSTVIRSAADLKTLDDDFFRSALLKPRRSQQFTAHFGVKGFMVDSRREALQRLDLIDAAGFEVILQDFVPGPPSNHYFVDGFVDRNGQLGGALARRRLRMDPPQLGNSTYTVSVPMANVAAASESLERLIAGIRLRGIFSAEFKLDERDGQFKILEINARPWWFVEFAAACGVNVCTMAYDDALGLPVDRSTGYAVGRACIDLNRDRHASMRLRRAGQLTRSAWLASWMKSRGLIFSWDDPVPWVQEFMSHTREVIHRRVVARFVDLIDGRKRRRRAAQQPASLEPQLLSRDRPRPSRVAPHP